MLGAPLVFASTRNALLIDEEFLSLRMPSAKRTSHAYSPNAAALLHDLENSQTVRGRVERLLIPSLNTGHPAMTTIASKMGVSRQTLFRILKTEGVTFATVLDEFRRELASTI